MSSDIVFVKIIEKEGKSNKSHITTWYCVTTLYADIYVSFSRKSEKSYYDYS